VSNSPSENHFINSDRKAAGIPSFQMDKFDTALGFVRAVRLSETNVNAIAEWCQGEVVRYAPKDAPAQTIFLRLKVRDRHYRIVEDTANLGEWIVDDAQGQVAVYADKVFLSMIKDLQIDEAKFFEMSKILYQLMEYQDFVTQKGGGTEETSSAAELAALQIAHLFQ
jgi:hypothetical protein